MRTIAEAPFAKITCPLCEQPKGFVIAAGRKFACSSCKSECECLNCGSTEELMYISSEEPYFYCGRCHHKFGWSDDGSHFCKATKNFQCYECEGWVFYDNQGSEPYWACGCGNLMIPNEKVVKRLRVSMAKVKPKTKTVSLDEYKEFLEFKNKKQDCWDEYQRFADLKSEIDGSMREIVYNISALKKQCLTGEQVTDTDIENLESGIIDLDNYFSQIFIDHNDELFEEVEERNWDMHRNHDDYDEDDDDDATYVIEEPCHRPYRYVDRPQPCIKEEYSEIMIIDDNEPFVISRKSTG